MSLRVRLRAELAQGPQGAPKRIRLRDFISGWYARNEPRWRHSTQSRNAQHADLIARSWLGDVFLDALAPADCEAWLGDLAAEKVTGKDGKPRARFGGHTCLGVLRVLRQVTRDAQARLELPRWACQGVERPVPVSHYTDDEPNLLSADELRRVLAALKGSPWEPLILTMVLTGLRFGEATALQWGDLDPNAGTIRVRRSQYRGVVAESTKTGRSRSVPLPVELWAVLAPRRGEPSAWAFPSSLGVPHKTGAVLRKPMQAALAKAQVSHRVTPHGLRRTLNNLVRQVASGEVVRSITGHSSEAMTDHYSHVSSAEKSSAVARVIELVDLTTPTTPSTTPFGGADHHILTRSPGIDPS